MSIQSSSTTLSKEMSMEESYSKKSVSSSTKMLSSRMESQEMMSSLMDSSSGLDSSALVAKMESDLSLADFGESALTGTKMSSLEKSSALMESEKSVSMKKSEMSSSLSMEESSTSISMKKEESVKMASEEISQTSQSSATYSMTAEATAEKDLPVYVVIMDYKPRENDFEGVRAKEGQEVEVLDSSKTHKWRVRFKESGLEGTIPSCYLEQKGGAAPLEPLHPDPKVQATIARREKVLKELVESEEAFSRDMQFVVNNYIKEMDSKAMPKDLRDLKDVLFSNFKAISEFHNNVLIKGIQYYVSEPTRLGKTFLRLERDFDMHVQYCKNEPEAQLLLTGELKNYFDKFSQKQQDEKLLSEHLKLPIQRINDYQLLLKELIKYTSRLKEDTDDLEKALDFMIAIPQRIADLQYLNSIQGYKGNLHKLGRILKHDWFEVHESSGVKRERFLFLFKGRIFVTDHKRVASSKSIFLVKNIIKLPEVEIIDNADDDELKMRFQSLTKGQAGYPISIKAKTADQKEEWLGAIQATAMPKEIEDAGDEDLELLTEDQTKKPDASEVSEKIDSKVEILEDFEAYEEMHTVITESVRSGSLTSLEDFQSAMDDEASLCLTVSEMENGGPGAPRFIKPLRAVCCSEGTEVVLECDICSSPDATVAWLKDNLPMQATKRAIVESDGGKHRLVIKKTEASDSGLYTIIASNANGTISCSAPLAVHSAPECLPPTSPNGTPLAYGPIFMEKLRDVQLQEGTDFRSCVVVQGEPQPSVKFYKDDQELKSEGRVRVMKESNECYELAIDKITPQDAGKYSCVAISSCGQNITSCSYTVTAGKQIFKTTIEDLDDASTPEALDSEQIWLKDVPVGKDVESSERFKVEIDEMEDTVSLVFQHVTPGDAGMYTCVANTGSGKISCSAELTVQGGIPKEPEAPKTTASAHDVVAKEGGSALLELTATGFPKPKVTWSKDGEELKPNEKYAVLQEDDESYTMAIKNVTPEDGGKYSALAKNELGESQVDFQLKVTSPPTFIKKMRDKSAVLNEDLAFEVEVQGTPEPTITWCKDGQQLSPSDRVKITEDGSLKRLVISKVKAEDAGNYSCTIKNSEGTQAGFGALSVSSAPKFVQGLKDVSVTPGQDATFKVIVAGSPKPDLKWSKDGTSLKVDGKRIKQTEEEEGTYTLTIKECTKSNVGKYSCEVSNKNGKDETSATLSTNEKPTFEKKLEDKTVKEGEKDVELTVQVSGSPTPKIKWYIGDMEITESRKYERISSEDTGSHTLRIKEVTTEIEGNYKCEATSVSGTTSTSSNVKVIKVVKKAPPKFAKGLSDIKVKEGEDVTFNVKLSGTPKPDAKWTKDSAEIHIDGKHVEYKVEEDGDSLTLIIHKSVKEDEGKYSCTITNSEGSETTSSKVTVSEKEKSASFKEGLTDKTIKESEDLQLTVKYDGLPKPSVKWAKDGKELSADGKHVEMKCDEKAETLTLVIHGATKEDSGKYTCTIKNSIGSDTSDSKVTVEEKTESAKFVKGLKDQTIKEEEDASFTVTFKGKPKPGAKWTKDGAELTIDGKHFEYKKEEAEDSLTLILHKATKEDAGKYSCTITNSAGSDTSSSEVKVTEKTESAKFAKGLKDQTIKEEEEASFTVTFKGKPKPSAKWTKDGAELTIDGKHFEYKKEEAEDSLTLILHKATKEDAGKYSCTITNSAGSDTSSSEVKVTEITEIAKFTKGLKDISIKEEEDAEFTVKFSGKPKPTVKWSKDDAELTIDGKHFEYKKEEADDSLTLILHKASTDDTGKYSCKITNSSGSDTTSSELKVTERTMSPKFKQGLKDQSAKEEQTVKFSVKIQGKPKPSAKWTKDEAELKIDGKHVEYKVEEDGDSLTLILHQVTKDDSGKYSCIISNTVGTETSVAKLTVSDLVSVPEFTEGLENCDIKLGECLKLSVKFKGKPKPSAKWSLDGNEIIIDDKHLELKSSDGEETLTINNAKQEDAGKYTCVLTNSAGTCSSSGKVSVALPPQILKNLEDVEGEIDGAIHLNVKFEGQPEPFVIWSKDGKPLDLDGKHLTTAIEADDSVSLVINKVTTDDAGSYRCDVKNSHGSVSSSAKLTVTGKPTIKQPLQKQDVLEGSKNVEFVAEVKATPAPEISWIFNGKEIKANDVYKIESDPSVGRYKLIIKDAKPELKGDYTLQAKNAFGTASTSGALQVLEKPKFVKELSDVQTLEEETVRLEAVIKGCPAPKVTWLKGKKEIKLDSHCEAGQDNDTINLTIKDSTMEDGGTYTCKLKNDVGEATSSANVVVKSKKETQSPVFLTHLGDLVIVVGDAARFEVKITGKPQPTATWYKNKEELKEGEEVIIKSDDAEQLYTLTLKNLKVSDSGSYSCKAINKYGDVTEMSTLTVKEPVAPKIEGLEDVKVHYGAPARIKAKISGFPFPDIKWVKDGIRIGPKSPVYVITEEAETNKHAVSINSVKEQEVGTFKCIASNSAGEDEAICKLRIQGQAPIFDEELKDKNVDIDEDIHFEAKLHGYPNPVVIWSKDKVVLEKGGRISACYLDDLAELNVKCATVKDAGIYSCTASNDAGEASSKASLKVQDFAPKILEKFPSNLKLIEGENLKLVAKILGQPTPELKWFKDSKPLKPSPKVKTQVLPDGTVELIINDVTHDDAGNYKLQVSNDKGHASTESNVDVEFRPKNSKPFVQQLHNLELVTGSPLVLDVKISGYPKPDVSWYKNGQLIPATEKTSDQIEIKNTTEGHSLLRIEHVTEADSADYSVIAKNEIGEDSSSSVVKVEAPGKKPKFVKELKSVKILEGDSGRLEAVIAGHPPPTATWMHNGKNVMEGSHCAALLESNGLASLTFSKVSKEDGGLYTLIAANKLGKAISEAPLFVIPAAVKDEEKKRRKMLEFVQGLMPVLIPEGRPCKLEAQVSVDPKPISIKWSKDGKELASNERIEITTDFNTGDLKLVIQQMTPEDRGKYCILASDGQSDIKSEALVNMIPAMPGMSANKPYFIKGLEPITLTEGETLKLQAQLAPEFKCAIKWMKDGDDLVPNDRIHLVTQHDGTIGAIIDNATPEDAGKYVVIASNEEGKTRSSAIVAVVGDGFRIPEIVNTLKPTQLVEGQPGKLEAKIDGQPKPDVKWLRDGQPLQPDDRIQMLTKPDGTVCLEFDKVVPEDAGKYTLLISNIGGETRCSAPVDVKRPPLFAKPLSDVTAVEGLPNRLECKLTGEPTPSVKWTKNGADIPDDSEGHVQKVHLPDGTVALIFDKCTPEYGGSYKCTASNPHGDKETEANFKVIGKEGAGEKKAPSFLSPLSDQCVNDGDSFSLSALVAGNPLPNVSWTLNGQPIPLSEKVVPTFDGKQVTLHVHGCNSSSGGTYECKLSNVLGDVTSQAKVSVKANQSPKFIEKLSDMQFPTGETMKLTCRVEGVPKPDIEWYCNGSKAENGLKYTLSREDDKCILIIPRPRVKDSGVYECRAKNIVGKTSCSATVTVSGADIEGEAPMFLKKLRDTDALTGMTIKLTACIAGMPKPDIKWFKDGEQLSPNARRTFEVDPNGVIRLLIRNTLKSDAGTYRVSISNMFGSESCTCILRTEGQDKISTDSVAQKPDKSVRSGPPSPLAHAPYIFKMDDTSLSLGWRPARSHYPQVPSNYRLEMRRIPDGDWSTYRSGIKDSSCDVRDLVPDIDYEFRIRVENRYGASDPSPYVTAHRTKLRPPTPGDYRPRDYDIEHEPLDKYAAAPRFLRIEEDEMYGVKGQPARIEFMVYGCPQPNVTWYFNNVPVESGKYDFLEDRNGQIILFISRMVESDVGTYMCKAVNEHGEAQRKINLKIAEPPVFTKRPVPTTVLVHLAGEFSCKIIGVPNPKIKWFKDWHPLSESSRIQMVHVEPDTYILRLSGAILKDSGLYSIVASNIAGSSTSAAMLTVEESEQDYHISTYNKPCFSRVSDRPFEDFYDIGEELGRGTQGITYHAVDRTTGKSFGAKVMHGTGQLMDFMTQEMDIMSHICHPRLLRLWNAYQTKSSLTLATDICGGGELLPFILQHSVLTESLVAHYIKQLLEGLSYLHEQSIAHLGLTVGDLLVTRINSDSIKIGDFGLATRLYPGRIYIQEYGHPEFVSPEAANKQPVSIASDMWSVGIISYLLLTGASPFLRENDRETLKELQKGKADIFHDGFVVLSDDARDFVSRLLMFDSSQRMTVSEALRHKWLDNASVPGKCDELENLDRLKEYYKRWKSWYSNASCRSYYRRRTLESCFTHPSRMIYPPDEKYTPPSTPERELSRTKVKPSAFDDVTFQQRIEREPIDVRSESHYQNGPDTFLLPLRDPDFPVRIRRYLKVGANRSPILARHLQDKHWGYSDVAVKERRKFVDIMDEEIDDEKKGKSRSAPLRLRHEVGTVGSGFDHLESKALRKMRGFRVPPGSAPFFREKLRNVVIRENEEAVFTCKVASELEAQFSWFRNDGILIESSRITIKKSSDGRCTLTLNPAKGYDVGVYKCVARNSHGISVCRARLNIGSAPGKPEPPKTERCSDTEIYVTWLPPKFEGHSPTLGYSLEYKQEGEKDWTKVASNISHEFFLVRNLQPSTTYYFHVSGVNRFGWSEFSSLSEPTLTQAEATAKIPLSKAQKYQQDLTENGQELIMEEDDPEKLEYDVEEQPIEMEEGEPTELYNFITEIARGRFSLVQKVWVKKINAACVAKACQMSSDNHEFEIYKSLRHEKIAQLISASCSKNTMFLVMEKLSGVDVITHLASRPVYTEETVSRIIKQVIDALGYLHFRSICYFELQPDNVVMVDRHTNDIKLVDFGSALYIPDSGTKVQVKGCTEYLAPEVVKGEEVHSSVDIWGVGVLTYILLSGVSPFAGDSNLETKDNILFVRYHFDHLYKEVSQEATSFIMQIFKRTPQKRPTADECLENKWLLPNEFMIKKREHTIFLPHHLHEFSEKFHSLKSKATPPELLTIFGKPASEQTSESTE